MTGVAGQEGTLWDKSWQEGVQCKDRLIAKGREGTGKGKRNRRLVIQDAGREDTVGLVRQPQIGWGGQNTANQQQNIHSR